MMTTKPYFRTLGFCILSAFITISVCFAETNEATTETSSDLRNNRASLSFLRSQQLLFQSLSVKQQQQIRDLHAEIAKLDHPKQEHYENVMLRYRIWLDHLSESDRKKINDALTPEDRIGVIYAIRQTEWIESLPKSYRDQYKAAKDLSERSELIRHWREEKKIREEKWHYALSRRSDEEFQQLFENPDSKQHLDSYLKNLEAFLYTDQERKSIERAKGFIKNRDWLSAALNIWTISEQHSLIPGPTSGPKKWDELPLEIRKAINPKNEKVMPPILAQRPMFAKTMPIWPSFAIALSYFCHNAKNTKLGHEIKLPHELGPSKDSELPVEVRKFLHEILEPKLKSTAEGKNELEALKKVQGLWPEYPQKIMSLAKQNHLTVPGWSLPAYDLWKTVFPPRVNVPGKKNKMP